jgi:formylglycine-generating enzyme required for sulfatase activity
MFTAGLPLLVLAIAQSNSYGPPPGMVSIPRKAVEVGGDPKEIEELIKRDPIVAADLAGELGKKTQAVEAFHVSIFEVTNEQYLRFVNATGHRPPQHWGQAAIDEAKRAYVESNRDKKDAKPFVAEDWWAFNWRDANWSMPTDIATHPVVYVEYPDAVAYCQWAGLRLPTEFEFQAAARDTARQKYTWGNDWNARLAITSEPDRRAGPSEIGSIAEAASVHGVFDLCGNVWEWTSSPYVALPGFAPLTVKVGVGKAKRDVEARAEFDSSKRVVVGGSFANNQMAARLSTRRPTSQGDSFSALGFRTVADTQVGRGRAQALLAQLSIEMRRNGLEPLGTLGFERWIVGEGRGTKPGYAVIDGHEWLLWVPALKIGESNASGLKTLSKEVPVALGVFSTTVAIADPALPPGDYLVAWRTDGEPKRQREKPEDEGRKPKDGGDDAPPVGGAGGGAGGGNAMLARTTAEASLTVVQEPEAPKPSKQQEDPFKGVVNYDKPALIFYDATLTPVASIVAATPEQMGQSKETPYGSVTLLPAGEDVPGRETTRVAESLEVLRWSIWVKDGGNQNKGFTLAFDMGVAPGAIDPTWRR